MNAFNNDSLLKLFCILRYSRIRAFVIVVTVCDPAMVVVRLDVGFVTNSILQHKNQLSFLAVGFASLALAVALRSSSTSSARKKKRIIPSPSVTLLPKLSEKEIGELPYPPDVLPGPRDVASPYGTIRVYEWGSEDGRKVLLLHGISTPCISLGYSFLSYVVGRVRLVAEE